MIDGTYWNELITDESRPNWRNVDEAEEIEDEEAVEMQYGGQHALASRVMKLGARGHDALWIDPVSLYRQSPDAVRACFHGKVLTAIVAAATGQHTTKGHAST